MINKTFELTLLFPLLLLNLVGTKLNLKHHSNISLWCGRRIDTKEYSNSHAVLDKPDIPVFYNSLKGIVSSRGEHACRNLSTI